MIINHLSSTIHLAFLAYTILLFIRIVGSWFPNFSYHQIMRWVAQLTDPYLAIFRRFIPPIGGILDLSPLLAFFGLQISEFLILKLLYLLWP